MILNLVLNGLAAQDDPKPKPAETPPAQRKVTSYAELLAAFQAQKINFERNDSARSLVFSTSRGKFEGVMIVKWDGTNGVMHLVQTMPLQVPEDKRDLFLKTAQTLNHGFLFPGIGMNLKTGNAYYRITIPIAPRGYIFDYELGTYTRFAITKASEFMPTLIKVLDGKVKLDDVVLYHQKQMRKLAGAEAAPVKLSKRYTRTIKESKWTLDFSKPGQVQVLQDGKMMARSEATLAGNIVAFKDLEGPLATKAIGTYQVFVSDEKLTFRLNSDDAKERTSILTGGVWAAKK